MQNYTKRKDQLYISYLFLYGESSVKISTQMDISRDMNENINKENLRIMVSEKRYSNALTPLS